jgi:hypothetical protein
VRKLVLAVVLAVVLIAVAAEARGAPYRPDWACDGTPVYPGDDLDVAINSDPAGTATTFCVYAGTYPVDDQVTVDDGDRILGEPGTLTRRGPAVDPDPVVRVLNSGGLTRIMNVTAQTGRIEWLDVSGASAGYTNDTPSSCINWGEATNRCPANGTGMAIGAGESGAAFVFEHLELHDNAANCVTGVKGRLLESDLYRCSSNADYYGFSAGALKTIFASEIARLYVHDNEAVGLWCDQGCHDDVAAQPHGFWVHDNLVVDNGRAGVRYEFAPMAKDARPPQPTALIENNLLAGNGWGGVDVHDAQNATVRGNAFGPMTVAGVEYPHNGSGPEAIQFSEGDRTDLLNAEAYRNDLGGEAIDGCVEHADTKKVHCHDNTHAKSGGLRELIGYLKGYLKDTIGELV